MWKLEPTHGQLISAVVCATFLIQRSNLDISRPSTLNMAKIVQNFDVSVVLHPCDVIYMQFSKQKKSDTIIWWPEQNEKLKIKEFQFL